MEYVREKGLERQVLAGLPVSVGADRVGSVVLSGGGGDDAAVQEAEALGINTAETPGWREFLATLQ